MNVFEDLVVELKEENLLENTVMDLPANRRGDLTDGFSFAPENVSFPESEDDHHESVVRETKDVQELIAEPDATEGHEQHDPEQRRQVIEDDFGPALVDDHQFTEPMPEPEPKFEAEASAVAEFSQARPLAAPDTVQTADIQFQGNNETVEIRKPNSDREFFKKRAAGEMSSLKMVEAVLSAVEREYLKIIPNAYDDLEAKKALHAFLTVAEDESTDEHKKAEFKLLHETELWCSALAARDSNITVANLRRYCETCRPMLSSQAMLAIARFYRNLPYSENVRGKFDFVITRLFSRPVADETRNLLFSRDEMLGHIKTLYADWSSVPLYNADNDETQILLTSLSFEELSAEAELVPSFDDLIKSDFFGRLRLFKESIAELFFAPIVTTAAIESNVRIGNVYVKLIDRERKKMDSASIHQRFGDLDDQTVSEAVGRTLELVQILRERAKAPLEDREYEEEEDVAVDVPESQAEGTGETLDKAEKSDDKRPLFQRLKEEAYTVNRFFLVSAFVLIAASVGLYVWASYFAEPQISSAGVKTLSFQGTDLGENVKVAKLSGETLYIVGQPSLDGMPKEKLAEILQKFYQAGKDKGWLNVNLMNSEGKTIGFASATRMDVLPATPAATQ